MRDPGEKIYSDRKKVERAKMWNKMWNKKFTLALSIGILLLILLPVSYAYSNDRGAQQVQVEVAEPSVAPSWTAFGGAIGGVTTPGDLFYIDATDNATELQVTLNLANAKQLIHCYRYLLLKVGIYAESEANQWQKTSSWNNEPIADTYITLRNGQAKFALPGKAKYKVAIDDGCFYCVRTKAEGGSASPQFCLITE